MGRLGLRGALVCCIASSLTLSGGVLAALGHQTESNKGVSVTMHVTPDDEPVSGQASRIIVTKVRPSKGRFSFRNCACYLRVSDSAGNVVLNRNTKRTTKFTFPRATAYEIVFTGRVKRGRKFKRFRVKFAIRAS
jgi:hypothetical protein